MPPSMVMSANKMVGDLLFVTEKELCCKPEMDEANLGI
jgi:hypothetical protein